MVFGNGHWLQGEECARIAARQVYDIQISEHRVRLVIATNPIRNRGDAVGGPALTMEVTSPAPGVLRVRTSHHLGYADRGPYFELYQKDNRPLTVSDSEERIEIASGSVTLVINKQYFSMEYRRSDGTVICTSRPNDLAMMKLHYHGDYYDRLGDAQYTYMRQMLSIGVGEDIYGLGERFTPLIKNGQTVICRNEDGGTSTPQSYKNIPFYVSSRGYGVFVAHPEQVDFEVGTEQVNKVQFSVAGGVLDYYLFDGPTMKDVLVKYTDLTGKPALPPKWSFGLWLTTSFTTNYDEATVMSFIDGMLERGIPLRAFHFDCYWMKGFHWTDFVWDPDTFPDPVGMIRRIHDKGINVCVWINPYIGQESRLFAEGMDNGFLVKRADGSVWQWDMWQSGMALVDFTNPDARKWYQGYLEQMIDQGVDAFKTDFGERIPTEDVVYYDGSDPERMHNYYTSLYNQTVFEVLERRKGEGEAVLFARSATAGGQRFPIHWGGDCFSDYPSMEQSLRGGLSLQMSGFGYWAHDIGGFEDTSTPDVYKRWAAFGLMSSHSRLHGSSSYRVPWLYDDEAVDVVRFFTKLKYSLMPYLWEMAKYTHDTGIPMMRAMVLEFPDDPTCKYLDRQYMLGDSLLVAPIFNEDGMAEYYLPRGRWTNIITDQVYQSTGEWITEHHGYLSMPVLAREGAVIRTCPGADRPDYDYDGDGIVEKRY